MNGFTGNLSDFRIEDKPSRDIRDAFNIVVVAIEKVKKCDCKYFGTCYEAQRQLGRVNQYLAGQYRTILEMSGASNITAKVRSLNEFNPQS